MHSSSVICSSEHPRLAWHWQIKEFYRIFKEGQAAREVASSQKWQEKVSEYVGAGVRDT